MFLFIIPSLLLTSVLSQSLPFFSSHCLIIVLDLHQHYCRVSSTKTELEFGGQSPVEKHSRSMAKTYRPIIISDSPCRILTTNYQTPVGYVMDIVQGTRHQSSSATCHSFNPPSQMGKAFWRQAPGRLDNPASHFPAPQRHTLTFSIKHLNQRSEICRWYVIA